MNWVVANETIASGLCEFHFEDMCGSWHSLMTLLVFIRASHSEVIRRFQPKCLFVSAKTVAVSQIISRQTIRQGLHGFHAPRTSDLSFDVTAVLPHSTDW